MQKLTIDDILIATDGSLVCGDKNTEITDITTDSRKALEGVLFIPIVGERFDGHDFILSSLDNGAAAVLTHKDIAPYEGKSIIKVEDTFKALADVAKYY